MLRTLNIPAISEKLKHLLCQRHIVFSFHAAGTEFQNDVA